MISTACRGCRLSGDVESVCRFCTRNWSTASVSSALWSLPDVQAESIVRAGCTCHWTGNLKLVSHIHNRCQNGKLRGILVSSVVLFSTSCRLTICFSLRVILNKVCVLLLRRETVSIAVTGTKNWRRHYSAFSSCWIVTANSVSGGTNCAGCDLWCADSVWFKSLVDLCNWLSYRHSIQTIYCLWMLQRLLCFISVIVYFTNIIVLLTVTKDASVNCMVLLICLVDCWVACVIYSKNMRMCRNTM